MGAKYTFRLTERFKNQATALVE